MSQASGGRDNNEAEDWHGADLALCRGFAITRTENNAVWGVAVLHGNKWGVHDEDEYIGPQFYVGGLSRKLQFDLKLRLAPSLSSIEFIYNDSVLGRVEWAAEQPVRFAVSAPGEHNLHSQTFLARLSQNAIQRPSTNGATCKRIAIQWIHPASKHPTYEIMLPRMFISDQQEPNFIYRAKDRTIRGFEFPRIGPGEEVEQEKGIIGAGLFELKVRLEGLLWSQS